MTKTAHALIAVAAIAAAAGAYFWWQDRQAPVEPPPVLTAPTPTAETPPAATEPGIKYPVDAIAPEVAPDAAVVENNDEKIIRLLTELVGQSAMPLFRSSDFPHRVVATVDNLDRSFASPRLWPVQPMAGRFTVEGQDDNAVLAKENRARYEAFVRMVESVDTERALQLYVQFYPLLQNAYENLGYPNKYFNDRLIAVIDHLLKTPDIATPVRLRLTEVKGDTKPARPWVNYQFADPALESLSSGQKILLRMGPDQRQRLKIELAEIRHRLSGAKR